VDSVELVGRDYEKRGGSGPVLTAVRVVVVDTNHVAYENDRHEIVAMFERMEREDARDYLRQVWDEGDPRRMRE